LKYRTIYRDASRLLRPHTRTAEARHDRLAALSYHFVMHGTFNGVRLRRITALKIESTETANLTAFRVRSARSVTLKENCAWVACPSDSEQSRSRRQYRFLPVRWSWLLDHHRVANSRIRQENAVLHHPHRHAEYLTRVRIGSSYMEYEFTTEAEQADRLKDFDSKLALKRLRTLGEPRARREEVE
jgi:hypothetical protein